MLGVEVVLTDRDHAVGTWRNVFFCIWRQQTQASAVLGLKPVIQRLNAEITAALRDDAIQSALRAQGVEPAPTSAEGFEAYIQSETAKWARVIKAANIKLD